MRVLQVLDGFVPAKFGGTKAACYNLARALVKRGQEVFVYTTDADVGGRLPDVRGLKNVDGINVHYFRNISNQLAYRYRLFVPPGACFTAGKEIGSYDVIHLHCFRSFLNIVVYLYARKYNVPYIVDAHGSTPRTVQGKKRVKWWLKWLFDVTFGYRLLKNAARVIAETEVGIGEYKELGMEQSKIVLMPALTFDVEEFAKLPVPGLFRRRYNIQDKLIIMFLGRLHWIKGLDFLVESFAELVKDRGEAILVMVGPDDGYKSTLDKMISQLGLADRVLFTGFLGGEEKLAALVDADVVLQTSRNEQGAGAPLEAVMCGTPIIVTRNTGSGEDVKRLDAGYLVEYGNKSELRDTIQYVLANPAEAKIKAQKAREYIKKNLSWYEQAGNYEKLYKAVIEEA